MNGAHLLPVALLLVGMLNMPLDAQTVVESSNGTSSLVIRGGGLATVNFSDVSAKIGYTYAHSEGQFADWRRGGEVKVKAANGFASLANGADDPIQGEGRIFATRVSDTRHTFVTANWWGLEASLNRSVFSVATTSATTPVARHDTLFKGWAVTLYQNDLLNIPHAGGDVLFGVSAAYGRRNNYDQLKKVQVCQTVASSGTGLSSQVIQECKDAKLGDYKQLNRAVADIDLVWLPKALGTRLAFDALLRYDGTQAAKPVSPGAGVFVTKKGSPEVVVGGFLVEWKSGSKPKLGLQAGLPF